MKPYFAKYLPVEGEIKEGDKVFYSGKKLDFPEGVYEVLDNVKEMMSVPTVGGFCIHWHKRTYVREDGKTVKEGAYLKIGYNIYERELQKVKLFLCSRDIQVGDNVYEPTLEFEGLIRVGIYPLEKIDYSKKPESWIELDYAMLKGAYKVIGEISSGATWVKEGDEFTADELAVPSHQKDNFHILSTVLTVEQKEPKMTYLVKCPCCGDFK